MKKKLGSRRQNLELSKPTTVKQIIIARMFPLHQNLLMLQLRCIEISITALVSCLMFQVIYRIEKVGCCQFASIKHTYMYAQLFNLEQRVISIFRSCGSIIRMVRKLLQYMMRTTSTTAYRGTSTNTEHMSSIFLRNNLYLYFNRVHSCREMIG